MAVVVISYMNFHMGKLFESRINLLVTMVLTMIAFQVVVGDLIPKVDYLTWLHYFLFVNGSFVIGMTVFVVVLNKMQMHDEEKRRCMTNPDLRGSESRFRSISMMGGASK